MRFVFCSGMIQADDDDEPTLTVLGKEVKYISTENQRRKRKKKKKDDINKKVEDSEVCREPSERLPVCWG